MRVYGNVKKTTAETWSDELNIFQSEAYRADGFQQTEKGAEVQQWNEEELKAEERKEIMRADCSSIADLC